MKESKVLKGTIDCSAYPLVPDGLKVKRQKNGGIITIERCGDTIFTNGVEVELYVSERQRAGQDVTIPEVIDEIADKGVLNARVLDYLLAHQEFIPESWKAYQGFRSIVIFFPGTIYQLEGYNGDYIRGIHWSRYGEAWISTRECVAAPLDPGGLSLVTHYWYSHYRAAVCRR